MLIKLAVKKDVELILEVLNKVTLHLHKRGINQWEYPWDSVHIKNGIEESNTYKLVVDDNVIGTFVIQTIDHLNKLTIRADSLYVGRIAILPEYQGRNIGSMIIDFANSFAHSKNQDMYLDCWAGNRKLKDFYLHNGLDYVGDFPVKDYWISIFKF
ncbi:GNAT family N-acetyltransferase [Psychrobacillus sp. FSL H8-0483]|uniref:GNAT family N-acetyltransferase n=1 Tax=Psychrobacillus sp. FSL H8-0483 TaxID=2921389 RepID=UPI00315B0496